MKSTEEPETGVHKNVDREAEYPVIVKSNELAVDIDNEICNVLQIFVIIGWYG
jgi:hypothetical protein